MMQRVALIPARGGSKRLPRKNILPFLGKPIIAWTIEEARKSALFDTVVVSTDDQEIKKVALTYGAEVALRDEHLATDQASVTNVCLDYLENQLANGIEWKQMVVLYATAPLRTSEDIQNTLRLLENKICDFALAATEYALPPHQALKLTSEYNVTPMWPDIVSKKTSEIGQLVVDNGSTYAVNVPAFIKQKTFFGSSLRVNLMPRERSQDIDEDIDFKIAEFFAKQNKSSK